MTVRVRFSPSPTGQIHLGNARTALFNALFAKCQQGVFLLRIEDTDAARSKEEHVTSMMADLLWLSIDWQEGPERGGHVGPYWQSKRQDIYQHYYDILEKENLIYPCFCTDQELLLARKIQLSSGQAPRYSGTCKKLSAVQITERINQGKKPAWRFTVPKQEIIEFVDFVKGLQQFNSDDIGDFIVRRADGTAPFLFCNAIDDANMKITHVLRGEDHVANTPRQILILKALNLPVAEYGHLSLITGDDGTPLSKRHGSFALHDMRKRGYLPLAIINYLARLGHSSENSELLTFDELAAQFNLSKLSKSPARFDLIQLRHYQKLSVQQLSHADLLVWLNEPLAHLEEDKRDDFVNTIKANIEFPEDAAIWIEQFFNKTLPMDHEALSQLKNSSIEFFDIALNTIEHDGLDLDKILFALKQQLGVNGKKLFMPLRAALSGKLHGPELLSIVTLLGEEKVRERLNNAKELIQRA